jgi:hypothetical protein
MAGWHVGDMTGKLEPDGGKARVSCYHCASSAGSGNSLKDFEQRMSACTKASNLEGGLTESGGKRRPEDV